MKIKPSLFFLIMILLAACQPVPQNNPAEDTITSVPPSVEATEIPIVDIPTSSPTISQPGRTPEATQTKAAAGDDYDKMFEEMYLKEYGAVELKTYEGEGETYQAQYDSLPVNLSTLGNPGVIQGLTTAQRNFLSQNGFVVIQTGDRQFRDIVHSTAKEYGQPYYLTTDAAYHGLHVTFDELLASLEAEYMRPVLSLLLQAEYEQVSSYLEEARGTEIESDVQLSLDYLAVAGKLLYPEKELDKAVEERIAPQIEQILAYEGREYSLLIPNFEDDYGAYKPVGHYAGKPELETYFRALTWFGRVAFKFRDPDVYDLQPSRAPLIMTLALQEGSLNTESLFEVWSDLHELIDFMIGPSDDPGPIELKELMADVYGETYTFSDLKDETQWKEFLSRVGSLPAPKINSTFASFSFVQEKSRDWRFMGQVFTLDGFIFQNLVFDKVGSMNKPRYFPSGLDVAAVFGSQTAYELQEQSGATDYENYAEQVQAMQEIVNQQPQAEWTNRFYSAWLYAFLPQVETKDASLPPLMQSRAWTYKEMNSMLGSWAELKHDTILYAKMPEAAGGGGPPLSDSTPSYVEANPEVFYRLAYAAKMLHYRLYPIVQNWEYMGYHEWPSAANWSIVFREYFDFLGSLSNQFLQMGDLAVKELNHEEIEREEMYGIYACLTLKECHADHYGENRNDPPDPIPVIAAVAGAKNSILEAGVGQLNRIYVAVPLEGKLQIAQGGVFSYYEFIQPRDQRLTDEEWRQMLEDNLAYLPEWVSEFVLPGGTVHNELGFHVGDVLIVNEAGGDPPLNQRAEPTTSSEVINKFETGQFLFIIDGPVSNSEGTWWKVTDEYVNWREVGEDVEAGWIFQNPDWFERSYH